MLTDLELTIHGEGRFGNDVDCDLLLLLPRLDTFRWSGLVGFPDGGNSFKAELDAYPEAGDARWEMSEMVPLVRGTIPDDNDSDDGLFFPPGLIRPMHMELSRGVSTPPV